MGKQTYVLTQYDISSLLDLLIVCECVGSDNDHVGQCYFGHTGGICSDRRYSDGFLPLSNDGFYYGKDPSSCRYRSPCKCIRKRPISFLPTMDKRILSFNRFISRRSVYRTSWTLCPLTRHSLFFVLLIV